MTPSTIEMFCIDARHDKIHGPHEFLVNGLRRQCPGVDLAVVRASTALEAIEHCIDLGLSDDEAVLAGKLALRVDEP